MKFNDIAEMEVQQQKDPVDTDPNVVRLATEIAKMEQNIAQKKAQLNQARARVATNLARSHQQKSMAMDNNMQNKTNL